MKLKDRSREVFSRGKEGQLLPSLVPVLDTPDGKKWEVWMIPLTVGEVNEAGIANVLFPSISNYEELLVKEHIILPGEELSGPDIDYLQPDWRISLVLSLFYHSGLPLKNLKETNLGPTIKRQKTEFQKKVTEKIKKKSRHTKMIDFLHEKGYTVWEIPKLCYFEIDQLVEGNNERNKV